MLVRDKHYSIYNPTVCNAEKSLITLPPGVNVIKKFRYIQGGNKLACLSLASILAKPNICELNRCSKHCLEMLDNAD
jgi:hypothetical protein